MVLTKEPPTAALVKLEKDREQVAEVTQTLTEIGNAFTIVSAEDYAHGGELLADVKGYYKRLDDREKEITRPLEAAKKSAIDLFRAPKALAKSVETSLKTKLIRWDEDRKAAAKAEQDRLDREAAAEQRRLDDAARKKAEKLIAKGDEMKAQEVLDMTPQVPRPVVVAEPPKIAGLSNRVNWKYQIIDMSAFIKACAHNPKYRRFIEPNAVELGALARGAKDAADVPGVRFYPEKTMGSGSN